MSVIRLPAPAPTIGLYIFLKLKRLAALQHFRDRLLGLGSGHRLAPAPPSNSPAVDREGLKASMSASAACLS